MNEYVYDIFLWTLTILVDLFFREVHPRGSWKVPRRGPVIFVAAPHANQVCWPFRCFHGDFGGKRRGQEGDSQGRIREEVANSICE
jgi:hypothetical protein